MNQKEGVIKFLMNKSLAVSDHYHLDEIINFREKLFSMGLIGFDLEHRVGFGNLSQRLGSRKFCISGSQTGHIAPTKPENYCIVTDWSLAENFVNCEGQADASSESLTHAAIYESDNSIGAILHVHAIVPWKKLLFKVPTTRPEIKYGTLEMTEEINRLFKSGNSFPDKFIAMAGHEGGLIAFGKNFEETFKILIKFIYLP